MSAERAGHYKTAPEAYRSALDALALPPKRVLFVAGSSHDVPGAGAPVPEGAPAPLAIAADLIGLSESLGMPLAETFS